MLIADHKNAQKAFKEFEKLKKGGNKRGKSKIVRQTCADLTVHTKIEEEIFYPAARSAIKDADLMDEATVEHASAKDLIAELESMQPGDNLYDAGSPCWVKVSITTSGKSRRKCSRRCARPNLTWSRSDSR